VKKFYRIAVLVLIFCLCFTTATFGADASQNAVPANQENLFRCGHLPFAPGHEFQLVTLDDVAWRSGEYSGTPVTEKIPSKYPHFDTPSETPLLVLVLEFNNMKYQNNYDWGNSIFQGQYSLAQYYKDMSFNQFSFVPAKETSAYNVDGNHNTKDKANDGVVHITLNVNHGNWNLDDDDEVANWIKYLADGVKKADAYVDFSAFDKNNDGEITTDEMALAVVVAGYEAAADGSLSQGANYYLWSHAWNIYSGWSLYFRSQYPNWKDFLPCPDGVFVDNYIAIAEQLQKNRQEPISVLAHELGHYLGLPDLYDTDYGSGTWSTYDVSDLSVMCSGSWGWNNILNDYMPVAFDAWSRSCLGWVIPETVSTGTHNVVSDKGSAYNVLRVETGVSGDYYLLENREISGWDQGLNTYQSYAPNGGLVCWHIDDAIYNQYSGSNSVNNSGHRPGVMPLYPEKKNNKITFIGTLSYDGLNRPFFTYDIWNSYYAGTLDCVDFPTYNGSNSYSGRTFSGVQMYILQSADSHTIKVKFGDEEECEHTLVHVEAKPATCIAAGNIEYWTCSKCGMYFSDANGEHEIAPADTVIPVDPNAHQWNDGVETTPASFAADGVMTYTCELCGKTREVPITKYGFTVQVDGQNITNIRIVEGGYDASYADWTTGNMIEEHLPLAIVTVPEGTETAKITLNDHVPEYHTYYYTVPTEELGSSQYIDFGFGDMEDVNGMQAPVARPGVAYDAVVSDEQVIRVQTKYDKNWYSKNLYAILFEFADENEIIRLSGKDRYDTGIAAAEELKEVKGWDKFQQVIVASGADFPDALSASYLAARKSAPVILVGKDAGSISKVSAYVNENLASGGTVYIVGGNGAVTPEFESALTGTVKRVKGANRFETNIEVLKEAGVSGGELLVASGLNYADALSASATANPIFLVGTTLSASQKEYLEANKENFAATAYIIGGNGAVSEAVEEDMKAYVTFTKRVKGSDRFATSKAVAAQFFPTFENMVIASGMAFPDGLSGGPVAMVYGAPLILVADNHYDHATELFQTNGADTLVVMGGKGAVSKEIAEAVAAPAHEAE
jgi:M6 family metalloprotease-like protein